VPGFMGLDRPYLTRSLDVLGDVANPTHDGAFPETDLG